MWLKVRRPPHARRKSFFNKEINSISRRLWLIEPRVLEEEEDQRRDRKIKESSQEFWAGEAKTVVEGVV